ncbi:MAG: hypothetical protein WAW73_07090 [Rhodoferax sp.]
MSRAHKPDPYNGFKCDVERRRALSVREYRIAVVAIALAIAHSFQDYKKLLQWLSAMMF